MFSLTIRKISPLVRIFYPRMDLRRTSDASQMLNFTKIRNLSSIWEESETRRFRPLFLAKPGEQNVICYGNLIWEWDQHFQNRTLYKTAQQASQTALWYQPETFNSIISKYIYWIVLFTKKTAIFCFAMQFMTSIDGQASGIPMRGQDQDINFVFS